MDAEGNRQIDQLCGRLQTGAPAVAGCGQRQCL